MRKVSRYWREYWGHEYIISRLLKRRFRIHFETPCSTRVLTEPFEEFVLQQDTMQRGRYHSMAIYLYDNLKPTILPPPAYYDGRVVWILSRATVVVTTIRTGITKHYLN